MGNRNLLSSNELEQSESETLKTRKAPSLHATIGEPLATQSIATALMLVFSEACQRRTEQSALGNTGVEASNKSTRGR